MAAYGLLGLSKLRFHGVPMKQVLEKTNPWADLQMPLDRARRWHPLNRGVWVAARVTLAGHLLQAKGDRVSMHSSVEVRYPFLDEEVVDLLAPTAPTLETPRVSGQTPVAPSGRTLVAPGGIPATQSDFPRSSG